MTHDCLLMMAYRWVKDYCVARGGNFSVFVDHLGPYSSFKPPIMGDSVPDVFALSIDSRAIVVVEVETSISLLTYHTEKQLLDFLGYCERYSDSLFVLSVPWPIAIRARQLLISYASEKAISLTKTRVLSDLDFQKDAKCLS